MSVEFNLSNLIFVIVAGISGVWALFKVIAVQSRNDIKRDMQEQLKVLTVMNTAQYDKVASRLDMLDATVKSDAGQWQRVERELLLMKADMPLHYVRREDYIRGQTVMEAKQDALYSRIELLQQQIQSLIKTGVPKNG